MQMNKMVRIKTDSTFTLIMIEQNCTANIILRVTFSCSENVNNANKLPKTTFFDFTLIHLLIFGSAG